MKKNRAERRKDMGRFIAVAVAGIMILSVVIAAVVSGIR